MELTTENDLAGHAEAIRVLGKRMARDVVEIGRRLTICKDLAGHGNWKSWLEAEFGWSQQTATRFMDVHAMFAKFDKLSNLNSDNDMNIPLSGLYMLAKPNTPDEARDAVLDRAANGERLSFADVKKMIDDARKVDEAERKAADDEHKKKLAARDEELKQRLANLEKQVRAEYKGTLTQEDADDLVEKRTKALTRQLEETNAELEELRAKEEAKKGDERVLRHRRTSWVARADEAYRLANYDTLEGLVIDKAFRAAIEQAAETWAKVAKSLK
jgi:hypothetical protein